MNRLKKWHGAHLLCMGSMAVIVSLMIMLGLQYRSLTALERASAVEHRAMLMDYLAAVTTAVETFYRTTAERALASVPSAAGLPSKLQPIRELLPGVQLIFTASLLPDRPQVRFFRPSGEPMPGSPDMTLAKAVQVALAPWQVLHQQAAQVDDQVWHAHEQASAFRMILKPITDAGSRVIGLFGVVVDTEFLLTTHLPQVIETSLVEFCPQAVQDNAIVTVHDSQAQLIFSTQPVAGHDDEVSRPLSFLFTDWRLGIRSRHVTPEQWASRHFAINVSLSILVTGVLIAGILITFQAASHAMLLSQMKTDFVSNVSHELRTPLASIRMFSEFLRLGRVPSFEKVREYGEYIEAESRRLTQLINNILDFSKIESDQKRYHMEVMALDTMVTDVMETFHFRLRQRTGALMYEDPGPALPPVIGDPAAMAQALTNLLDNAVKYSSPEADIIVRLGQQGGWITLAVCDRGVGIPSEEQKKVFERFHRVSTGLVHDVKGSGLGLAIVSHIVEAHQGQVSLESVPGKGSTFTISLPASGSHATRSHGGSPMAAKQAT